MGGRGWVRPRNTTAKAKVVERGGGFPGRCAIPAPTSSELGAGEECDCCSESPLGSLSEQPQGQGSCDIRVNCISPLIFIYSFKLLLDENHFPSAFIYLFIHSNGLHTETIFLLNASGLYLGENVQTEAT